MFRDLELREFYNSDTNLLSEFYIPVLKESKFYYRIAGFLSTALFGSCFEGLAHFANNDGRIRIIFGSLCSPKDLEELKDAETLKGVASEKFSQDLTLLENYLESNQENYFTKRISLFSYLISIGRIEIKFALRLDGLMHEKIAVYVDEVGDRLSYNGSINETLQAFQPNKNGESFDLFTSWDSRDEARIDRHMAVFSNLWSNTSKNTYVFDIPTALKNKIELISNRFQKLTIEEEILEKEKRSSALENSAATLSGSLRNNFPQIPLFFGSMPFELRIHQKLALTSWMNSNYSSILQLCTGAGKTLTSIYAISKLFLEYFEPQKKNFFCIIVVPYINLAEQWCEELSRFNIFPLRCYTGSDWRSSLPTYISDHSLKSDNAKFSCAVVVSRTFRSPEFQSLLNTLDGDFLFCADEVHNLDNSAKEGLLPKNANYRLGLSATIQGCNHLSSYFSPATFVYSLSDAIRDKILCEYKYIPVEVHLDSEEVEAYFELMVKISSLEAQLASNESFDRSNLDYLYGLRSDLLGNAKNKIHVLKDVVSKNLNLFRQALFYCSSTMTDASDEEDLKQVDEVVEVLDSLGLKTSKYVSDVNPRTRKVSLSEFKEGNRNALVAIRCLDEGVDIPDVGTAFLISSSSNPKQFIQRRGRVLRKSANKEFATIFDIFISVTTEYRSNKFSQRLIKKELERMIDFSLTARNKNELLDSLNEIALIYNIDLNQLISSSGS